MYPDFCLYPDRDFTYDIVNVRNTNVAYLSPDPRFRRPHRIFPGKMNTNKDYFLTVKINCPGWNVNRDGQWDATDFLTMLSKDRPSEID